MAPQQHLDWFADNIDWYSSLPVDSLDVDVPNCPGWTVEHVLNHLTFGLGLAYPYALNVAPEADTASAFSDVPWPERQPTGPAALSAFAEQLNQCLATFRATDPEHRCWTYEGPGRAGFWFRRAAIETTLHRMDVADALVLGPMPLADDRVTDAIAEAVEFALPLAATMMGHAPDRSDAMAISVAGRAESLTIGTGTVGAEITGTGTDVLAALWGRHRDRVDVTGDRAVADRWLSLIDQAFAGR